MSQLNCLMREMKYKFLSKVLDIFKYKNINNNGLKKLEKKIREIEIRNYNQERKGAFGI